MNPWQEKHEISDDDDDDVTYHLSCRRPHISV